MNEENEERSAWVSAWKTRRRPEMKDVESDAEKFVIF